MVILPFFLSFAMLFAAAPTQPAGSINGNVAIKVIPVREEPDGRTTALPTTGCDVHLVLADEQISQSIFPCGEWFQPVVGRHLFWLEHGSSVSYQTVLSYAGEPFSDSGLLLPKTVVPAGTIHLDEDVVVPKDATFRVVSLTAEESHRPFDRRLPHQHAHESVRVPAGPVIAGIFDPFGSASSLSRPVEVATGHSVNVHPTEPAGPHAHVLGIFSRSVTPGAAPCAITFTSEQMQSDPDVHLQTEARIIVAWYDIAASTNVRLQVNCDDATPFTRTLRLRAGMIETIRATLVSSSSAARP